MADALGRRHRAFGLIVAVLVLLADQISKWLIMGPLALPQRGLIPIMPFFDLRWVENYGISMGFLVAGSNAERWILVGLTSAIAIGVIVWLWRETARIDVAALGLVLGGAVGNIADRTRLGYVADFLDPHIGDWHPFLVFNVADAAITIGVVILVARALFARVSRDGSENIDAV